MQFQAKGVPRMTLEEYARSVISRLEAGLTSIEKERPHWHVEVKATMMAKQARVLARLNARKDEHEP